jgi:hypothetical protein
MTQRLAGELSLQIHVHEFNTAGMFVCLQGRQPALMLTVDASSGTVLGNKFETFCCCIALHGCRLASNMQACTTGCTVSSASMPVEGVCRLLLLPHCLYSA